MCSASFFQLLYHRSADYSKVCAPFSLSRISLEWPVTVETARTIQLKFEEVSLQGQQPQPLPVPTSVEPGTFWGSASST